MGDDRGQSSVTGTVLLVAIVLLAATVAGVWAFSVLEGLPGDSPSAGAVVTAEHSEGTLTLEHGGGSSLPLNDTNVIVSSGTDQQLLPLSALSEASGDGDVSFETGERRSYVYTPGADRFEVLVVEDSTGVPLLETTLAADSTLELSLNASATNGTAPLRVSFTATGSGGATRSTPVDFGRRSITSYGGSQDADGNSSVRDGGIGLGVYGDSWRAVDLQREVTQDTVLHLEFRSDDEGEIHAIGLDEQRGSISGDRLFALDGTQQWGIRDFAGNYTTGQGWRSYEIPIGQYYTGQMEYLVFAADGDTQEGASEFRNVRLSQANRSALRYGWSGDTIGAPAGQTLNHTFAAGGTYDVSVTATDAAGTSRTATTTVSVDPAPAPLDFSNATVTPYEPAQDNAGGATVPDPHQIELTNNTWKQVSLPAPCSVDPTTVLVFEFRSDRQGEIHALGFDDGSNVNANRLFQLYGTQPWGIDAVERYEAGEGWTAYEVPVGEHYTGSFGHLAIATDDDVDADAHTAIRNLGIYDRSGGSYTRICG